MRRFCRPCRGPSRIGASTGRGRAFLGIWRRDAFGHLPTRQIPTNPDTKSHPPAARGPAPGLAGRCAGTADEIDTSSERARRGLDRAPRVKPTPTRQGAGGGQGASRGVAKAPRKAVEGRSEAWQGAEGCTVLGGPGRAGRGPQGRAGRRQLHLRGHAFRSTGARHSRALRSPPGSESGRRWRPNRTRRASPGRRRHSVPV